MWLRHLQMVFNHRQQIDDIPTECVDDAISLLCLVELLLLQARDGTAGRFVEFSMTIVKLSYFFNVGVFVQANPAYPDTNSTFLMGLKRYIFAKITEQSA
ncbi:hypothetical protein WCLP8_3840024 [uncultured Gammaproteobacteria bacterium]